MSRFECLALYRATSDISNKMKPVRTSSYRQFAINWKFSKLWCNKSLSIQSDISHFFLFFCANFGFKLMKTINTAYHTSGVLQKIIDVILLKRMYVFYSVQYALRTSSFFFGMNYCISGVGLVVISRCLSRRFRKTHICGLNSIL